MVIKMKLWFLSSFALAFELEDEDLEQKEMSEDPMRLEI